MWNLYLAEYFRQLRSPLSLLCTRGKMSQCLLITQDLVLMNILCTLMTSVLWLSDQNHAQWSKYTFTNTLSNCSMSFQLLYSITLPTKQACHIPCLSASPLSRCCVPVLPGLSVRQPSSEQLQLQHNISDSKLNVLTDKCQWSKCLVQLVVHGVPYSVLVTLLLKNYKGHRWDESLFPQARQIKNLRA